MWLNIKDKTINLEIYFLYLMKGVYFRHLNNVIGLQLQLSLINSRNKMIRKPKLLRRVLSGFKDLMFPKKLEEYRQAYLNGTELNYEKISSEIIDYLLSEFRDQFYYFDIPFYEDNMLNFIYKEFSLWLKSPDSSVDVLLTKFGREFTKGIIYPDFLKKEKLTIEKNTPQDLQSFWNYFFGKGEDVVSRLENLVKKWDWQNSSIEAFISKYQLQSKATDTMRLKLMLQHPFEQVIRDLTTHFEDWLALCFSTLAKTEPRRFLNINGLKFKSEMRRLIENCEGLTSLPDDIVTELARLERLNVGNAGKKLKNYIENHAKFRINDSQGFFAFYVELRKLRDSIVHPEAVQKSNLVIPHSHKDLLGIIDKLTEFGLLIIETCNITTCTFG